MVKILCGVAQGATKARKTREPGCDRMWRLARRHELRANALAGLKPGTLPDAVVEADQCHVDAGREGMPHRGPDDSPRCRAKKRLGHGSFANDRPPVAAMIGRDMGRACFHVVGNSGRRTPEGLVSATTVPAAVLNTDEWRAYGRAPELGRGHMTVNHGAGAWARDDDGDGVREVHLDTMGYVDGTEELPSAVPGREQVVPGRLLGDLRVVERHQAGQRWDPGASPRRPVLH